MSQHVGAQLGHTPWIVLVPVLVLRFSLYWIGPVTDVDTGVARLLIERLKDPVVVGDDRIHDIAMVDGAPFDAAVERIPHEERE